MKKLQMLLSLFLPELTKHRATISIEQHTEDIVFVFIIDLWGISFCGTLEYEGEKWRDHEARSIVESKSDAWEWISKQLADRIDLIKQ